jgi:uncharacterized membrane protein YfcA
VLADLGPLDWAVLATAAALVGFAKTALGGVGLTAVLAPAVLAGGMLGRRAVHRVDQVLFERLVLLFTVVSSLNLLR